MTIFINQLLAYFYDQVLGYADKNFSLQFSHLLLSPSLLLISRNITLMLINFIPNYKHTKSTENSDFSN